MTTSETTGAAQLESDDLVPLEAACKLLATSATTLKRRVAAGMLAAPLRNGGRLAFRKCDLLDYVRALPSADWRRNPRADW